MKFKHLVLSILLLPCMNLQALSLWDSAKNYWSGMQSGKALPLRVLVLHDVPEATLDVSGEYVVYDPHTGDQKGTRFLGKSRKINGLRAGLEWGEFFPEIYQLKFQPRSETTRISVDGIAYEGSIYVYDIGQTISVINELSLENYVKSVLASHQLEGVEPEVLHALAIVARTNAYFQLLNPRNNNWDVDGRKLNFQGMVSPSSQIVEAVRSTQNMVLSLTGVYEKIDTPFPGSFDGLPLGQTFRDPVISKITLEQANQMAKKGEHAAQILSRAYPDARVMLINYSQVPSR